MQREVYVSPSVDELEIQTLPTILASLSVEGGLADFEEEGEL